MNERKKDLKRDLLSAYGGDSENSSALHDSELYGPDDAISDGVKSFFADEQERR